MKTNIHMAVPAGVSSNNTFQTKVVETIKTHVLC